MKERFNVKIGKIDTDTQVFIRKTPFWKVVLGWSVLVETNIVVTEYAGLVDVGSISRYPSEHVISGSFYPSGNPSP